MYKVLGVSVMLPDRCQKVLPQRYLPFRLRAGSPLANGEATEAQELTSFKWGLTKVGDPFGDPVKGSLFYFEV